VGSVNLRVGSVMFNIIHTSIYLSMYPSIHVPRSIIWEKTFRPFMNERERRKIVRERDLQGTNNERYTQSGKLRRKYARKEAVSTAISTSQAVMSTQAANVRYYSFFLLCIHLPTYLSTVPIDPRIDQSLCMCTLTLYILVVVIMN